VSFPTLQVNTNEDHFPLLFAANCIGNEGARALAELVETNVSLIRINVSDNKITAAMAERLAEALARNTSLLQFEVKGAGIEGQSLAKIEGVLARNKEAQAALFDACGRGDITAVKNALEISASRVFWMKMVTANDTKTGLLEYACRMRQDGCAALILSTYCTQLHRFPDIPQQLAQVELDTLLLSLGRLEADAYSATDACGRSLLHWVAESRAFSPETSAEAVGVLMRAGCDADLRDTLRGSTPLLLAGAPAAAVFEQNSTVDINACDCFGKKSLHIKQAVRNEHIDRTVFFVLTGSRSVSRLIVALTGHPPWWRASLLPLRSLPLGCFPLIRVSEQTYVRLCEFEFVDIKSLSERANSGLAFLHLYATEDGVQMRHVWMDIDQCSRTCRGLTTGKTVSIVAGLIGKGTLAQGQLVVFAQDVRSEAQARGLNAHAEFSAESAMAFLRLCLSFREHRAERLTRKARFSQSVMSASLVELVAPPPADTHFPVIHVIFCGPPSTGKSSLLLRLKKKTFSSRKRKATAAAAAAATAATTTVATATVEPTLCMSGKHQTLKKASLVISDFSGLPQYALVQEFFFSPHNTVYALVFDATTGLDELKRNITETLIRLRSHARGPRCSCRVLIFCNKSDKLSEKARNMLQSELRQYFSILLAHQPVLWDLVCVSSVKSTKRFRNCFKHHIASLARSLAPQSFVALFDAISRLPATTPLAKVRQLRETLPKDLIDKLDSSGSWQNALDFLRDVGVICFSDTYDGPEEERVICLDTSLLARGLGSFVAPQAQLDRLASSRFEAGKAWIPQDEFERRVRSVTGLKGDQLGMFLLLCQQLRFCFPFNRQQEDVFVIPHLLPEISTPSLPPLLSPADEPRARGTLVRMRCLGWSCRACNCSVTGSLPELCMRCGKTGQCEVACCNEPPCTFCASGSIDLKELPLHLVVQETKPDGSRMCTGVSPVSGKPFSLTLPPECACTEAVTGVAFLSEAAPLVGSHTMFSRLICQVSTAIDASFCMWRNACVLRDVFGNTILLTDKDGCRLEIAVRGAAPFLWRTAFPHLAAKCEQLCPVCVQAGGFVPFDQDAVPPPPVGFQVCMRGHRVSKADFASGVPLSTELARDSLPWAPQKGQFFADTTNKGLWRTRKGMRTTELYCFEDIPSRKAEFSFAERAFFSFMGPDSRSRFELRRVTFIFSDALESTFSNCHANFLLRVWSPQAGSSALSSSTTGQSIQLALGWQGMCEQDASRIEKTKLRRLGASDATSPGTGSRKEHPREIFTFQSPQWALSTAKVAVDAAAAKRAMKTKTKQQEQPQKEENSPMLPGAEAECLVASWVLQGNVCTGTSTGSSTAQQYDSDLVSVPQDGIAIRSAEQSLPRYVFHFNSFVSVLREDLNEANTVLLTVGIASSKQLSEADQAQIKQALDNASCVTKLMVENLASAAELHTWLCKYGFKILNKLRVAMCDVLDSGDPVSLVVDTTRTEVGSTVPCLVLLSDASSKLPASLPPGILVASDKSKLTDFCLFGRV